MSLGWSVILTTRGAVNLRSARTTGHSGDSSFVRMTSDAYQNFCMHAGHPLNWKPDGFLTGDGSQIICSSHGAIYEIESGECVAGPCPGRKLRPVEVEIRDGEVVVRGPAIQTANRC